MNNLPIEDIDTMKLGDALKALQEALIQVIELIPLVGWHVATAIVILVYAIAGIMFMYLLERFGPFVKSILDIWK